MGKSKKKQRDSLPEQFGSLEEAGEFWDTHINLWLLEKIERELR